MIAVSGFGDEYPVLVYSFDKTKEMMDWEDLENENKKKKNRK